MADRDESAQLGAKLLGLEEHANGSYYGEYRMNLERTLVTAERRERITTYIAGISFTVGVALMFVGGTRLVGDFDPWSNEATPLSIGVGLVYVLACMTFPLALAIGLSRYRRRVHTLKDQLRDTLLLDLRREVRELREQVESFAGRGETSRSKANPR
jgi:hypothetical protein